jgi:serine-type D-Ala-D-Ala carboxypeptidase/endopeptidase
MATINEIEQAAGDVDASGMKHGNNTCGTKETTFAQSTTQQPKQSDEPNHATPWDNSSRWRRLGLIGAILVPLAIVIFSAMFLSLPGSKSSSSTNYDSLVDADDPNTSNGTSSTDYDSVTVSPPPSSSPSSSSSTRVEEEQRLRNDLLGLQQDYFGGEFEVGKRCDAGSVMGVTRLLSDDDDTSNVVVSRIIVPFGKTTMDDSAVPITEDTLFEIGSVSKPLTALVLADLIVSGMLGDSGLDTPLNSLLPAEIPELKLQDQQDLVTLRQLVTHTAGLPRLSAAVIASSSDWNIYDNNPYAGYSEQDMIDDLIIAATENVALTPPNTFLYSNFGFSVLAYILSRTAGATFSELQKIVTDRLGMDNTWIVSAASSLPENVQDAQWLSSGYNEGKSVPYWFDGGLYIDGAGSTLSSAKDLLRWIELLMDPVNGEIDLTLSDALELSRIPLLEEPDAFEDIANNAGIAYAWFYNNYATGSSLNTSDITYFHSGGTAGYATLVAFQPSSKVAVIGMTNCANMAEDLFEMVSVMVIDLFGNVSELIF